MFVAVASLGIGIGLFLDLSLRDKSRTTTVRITTYEAINGMRSAGVRPAPIPDLLEGSTDPRHLVLSDAVPADATVNNAAYVDSTPKQLVVSWSRAHLVANGAALWQRVGIAIWQLNRGGAAAWHRIYTFENAITNRSGTVQGFDISTGDISGDRRPEVLVFFDSDGSAGTGRYHLLASEGRLLRQPLVMHLSNDQGSISFDHGELVIRQGVDYHGPGIHCCFRRVRTTVVRWNGSRLVTVRRAVGPNRRGWPPG